MNTAANLDIFKQFADALPFGVYILKRDGTIQYWNRAAEKITGYLSQEALGRACNSLLVHCDAHGSTTCKTRDCSLIAAVRGSPSGQVRVFARHKEGHRIPILIRAIPLRDEVGTIIAVAELFQAELACPEDLTWIDEPESPANTELGICSFSTTQKQLRSLLSRPSPQIAAFVIEIEHLRELAKKHGGEMARIAQRAVIHTLTRTLDVPHYLGLWEDNSLFLLVPDCCDGAFAALQQTLGSIGSSCWVMWWGDRINFRVLARGTHSHYGDSLETLTERLCAPPPQADGTPGDS